MTHGTTQKQSSGHVRLAVFSFSRFSNTDCVQVSFKRSRSNFQQRFLVPGIGERQCFVQPEEAVQLSLQAPLTMAVDKT